MFGTDGSDTADLALPLIERIGAEGGRVVLVHADEMVVTRGGPMPRYADEKELRTKVERKARRLEQEGFDAHLRVACSTSPPVPSWPSLPRVEARAEAQGEPVGAETTGH